MQLNGEVGRSCVIATGRGEERKPSEHKERKGKKMWHQHQQQNPFVHPAVVMGISAFTLL